MANDETTPVVEVPLIERTPEQQEASWKLAIFDKYNGQCANCGSDDHVSVVMLVPEAAGGRYVLSNGYTICRVCRVAAKAVEKAAETGKSTHRRPINLWISQQLYGQLTASLETRKGFSSMGSLVRYMMGIFVEDPSKFEDVRLYQDHAAEVKINLWVDPADYDLFKQALGKLGLSVTEAVRALLVMYVAEATPVFRSV